MRKTNKQKVNSETKKDSFTCSDVLREVGTRAVAVLRRCLRKGGEEMHGNARFRVLNQDGDVVPRKGKSEFRN